MDWFNRVEFRPSGGGTIVAFETGGTAYDTQTDDHSFPREMNWRSVASFLLETEDVRVFGSWREYEGCIDVTGVADWMKIPISLALIMDEDLRPRYGLVVHRLMALGDEEAEAIAGTCLMEILRDEGG